jgi:DNA-binding protein H-NS
LVKIVLSFYYTFKQSSLWDERMPLKTPPLATLSNEALCKLRDEIAAVLSRRAEELRKELNQLTGGALVSGAAANGRKYTRKTKGNKIAPKYRGPDGSTWCGRGLKPRWLTNEMKQGKKPEDFLIVPRDKDRQDTLKSNASR